VASRDFGFQARSNARPRRERQRDEERSFFSRLRTRGGFDR
jgi:hypothetical protein